MRLNLINSFSSMRPFTRTDIEKIFPYFQPIVQLNGEVVGFETLARMTNDEGYIRTPFDFMKQIGPEYSSVFDLHMLEQACIFLARCGNFDQLPVVNVNFSPLTLAEEGIANKIAECLKRYSVSASNIGIEITEQSFDGNQEKILANVKEISEMGNPILIDDFGAESADVARLKVLKGFLDKDVPLTVKLDMSVVQLQEWTKSFSAVLKNNLFKKVKLVFEGISEEGMELVRNAVTSNTQPEKVEFQTFGLYEPMTTDAAFAIVKRNNTPVAAKPVQQSLIPQALV